MSSISGTAKADKLSGTDQIDRLYGLDGNDILTALGGNDTLDGGIGADQLIGGRGDDLYIVDNKADIVVERGGEGIDTVQASVSFTLAANVENLLLIGSAPIYGAGNELANTLTGNGAANLLSGRDGDDTLNGGGGKDVLIGGRGRDTLIGGAGDDTFRFFDGELTSRTASGADTIVDFQPGDRIDLSKVDALVAPSEYIADGKQSFHFIGTNHFHAHSGREIRYEITGSDTYVYGSINGDDRSDFVLHLDGVHRLSSSDFIF